MELRIIQKKAAKFTPRTGGAPEQTSSTEKTNLKRKAVPEAKPEASKSQSDDNLSDLEEQFGVKRPKQTPTETTTSIEPTPGPSQTTAQTPQLPYIPKFLPQEEVFQRKRIIFETYLNETKDPVGRKAWRQKTTVKLRLVKDEDPILLGLDKPPMRRLEFGPCRRWNHSQNCYLTIMGLGPCKYLHCCIECFFFLKMKADHRVGLDCPVITFLERATRE